MPRPEDLDCLFGVLINMGAKEQETGPNYMKFLSGGNSYVLEWIGDNLLLWKANMLFREGCKLYPFDKKTMDGFEVGEEIWNDLTNVTPT